MVLGKPKSVEDKVDMVNSPLWGSIFTFAMPIAISGFLQLLFNAADLVVVGRYGLPNSLAAVGATHPLSSLFVNLFMGLSVGVGVVVSNGLGENDWKKTNRAVHTAIPLALVSGIFVAIIGCLIARPMLVLMGTPESVLDRAVLYIDIVFIGMPANLVYNYGSAILRADGDSRRPLMYLTIAGVLNVILNLFFVIVCKLDVAGVALATALTTILSAFLTVRRCTKIKDVCRLQFRYMKLYKEPILQIVKIGLPAGIQNAMFSLSNIVLQSAVNSFGTAAMNANSASQSIQGFCFVFLNGFAQASVNFSGENYGARKFKRVYKTKNICILYQILFAIVLSGVCIIWGRQLLSIYIPNDPEALALGYTKLVILASTSIFNAVIEVISSCLRGIGYSTIPMAISLLGICGVRLLLVYTIFRIEQFHTYAFLNTIYPISWLVTLIVDMVFFAIVAKKKLVISEGIE